MDSLRPGGRKAAEPAAVERVLKAEDRELGRARLRIIHARLDLLLGPPDALAPLAAPVQHERGLVRQLVRLGARLRREDLVQPLGRDLEEAVPEDLAPLLRGEVADGVAVC